MTPSLDWSSIFNTKYPVAGVSVEDLAITTESLCAPLSERELQAIADSQTNPFPPKDPLYAHYRPFDPNQWQLPSGPLPPSYLDFLRWSNGGSFFNDDRHFDPFLSCQDLRRYLVGYHIPQYMLGAMPFALNGEGGVYLFDMRRKAKKGEYPILFSSLGSLRYEQAVKVATSFLEACSGTTDPQELM